MLFEMVCLVTLLNIIGHPIIGSLCEAGTSTLAQYILVVSLSHIGLLKFWSQNGLSTLIYWTLVRLVLIVLVSDCGFSRDLSGALA